MFIFLSSDGFQNTINVKRDLDKDIYDKYPEFGSIRRPYRGIQIKEDTYSTLSVRRPSGLSIPLTSSSDRYGYKEPNNTGTTAEYADYILQGVQESRVEKQQIIETFGDPYVYFFGERPRVLQVSGLLMNTEDFDWRSQFWKNYEEHLRGTKLVQQNARAYLSYDTIIVEGYLLNAAAVDSSDTPYSIPFNFSMLVTNYYNWADIGQTLFPAAHMDASLEVLNRRLADRRGKFVSTGAQVRLKNLLASPGSGVFSTIRSGIQAVNQVTGLVGSGFNSLNSVVGGRSIRVPIGIAGFLQSAGAATIGAGSIGGSAVLSAEGLGAQFDAATGRFKGVRGSVSIRMPSNALFAPPWISQATKQPRGYIFENIDEYPSLGQPEYIRDLLSRSDYVNYMLRGISNQTTVEENKVLLAKHNLLAEAGGVIADSIADSVKFAKASYAMVMTAKAFLDDPSAVVGASLGIGVGNPSNTRLARGSSQTQFHAANAIKTRSAQARAERVKKYVGEKALESFSKKQESLLQNPVEAELGEVYKTSSYVSQAGDAATFEDVYVSNDYTPLIDRAIAVDAETALTGEETGFSEKNVKSTLDEVFGNVDTPPGPDVEPSNLVEVYGTGSKSKSVRTPAEIAAALQDLYGLGVEADEDTAGIIGVDDAEAQIDPVI